MLEYKLRKVRREAIELYDQLTAEKEHIIIATDVDENDCYIKHVDYVTDNITEIQPMKITKGKISQAYCRAIEDDFKQTPIDIEDLSTEDIIEVINFIV